MMPLFSTEFKYTENGLLTSSQLTTNQRACTSVVRASAAQMHCHESQPHSSLGFFRLPLPLSLNYIPQFPLKTDCSLSPLYFKSTKKLVSPCQQGNMANLNWGIREQ